MTNDGAAKVFATFGSITKPLTITGPPSDPPAPQQRPRLRSRGPR